MSEELTDKQEIEELKRRMSGLVQRVADLEKGNIISRRNDLVRHNLEIDRRAGPPSTFPFASIWPF